MYFTDVPKRLARNDLESMFPGLISKVAALDRIGAVMVRDQSDGVLVTAEGEFALRLPLVAGTRALLERFDSPDVLAH